MTEPTAEELQELVHFPPVLRALIDAELAVGNSIESIGHSFPAPPAGAYVRLRYKVTTRAHESDEHLDWRGRFSSLSSGEFTDAKRFYFVVEPPDPPPEETDMDALRGPPELAPQTKPAARVPTPIDRRRHIDPPITAACSGEVTISEFPAAVALVVPLQDSRTLLEIRALLERELAVPFVLQRQTDVPCLRAAFKVNGADYLAELRCIAASATTYRYQLGITASWATFAPTYDTGFRREAEGWFSLWTRHWPAARLPEAPRDDPSLLAQITGSLLEEDQRLQSIVVIQREILTGLRAGGWYSQADKEGTYRMFLRGHQWLRVDEGEYPASQTFDDDQSFLDALLIFNSLKLDRHPTPVPLSDVDRWRLILRLMNTRR
jgi:hypothetical protein